MVVAKSDILILYFILQINYCIFFEKFKLYFKYVITLKKLSNVLLMTYYVIFIMLENRNYTFHSIKNIDFIFHLSTQTT